jgi:class 3 adenylate cyclase
MLPTGTVTFLMTDVEDSTGLVERLGERWDDALARQRELVRSSIRAAGGEEIDAHGDELFAAFSHASAAATAAREIQRAFAAEPWPDGAAVRVRIGLHTGEPRLSDEGYLGIDVHVVARVCAAGHGGQVLATRVTAELLAPEATVALGEHQLKGVARSIGIFQLVGDDPGRRFAPLRAARDDAGLVQEREDELAGAALAAVRPRLLSRALSGRKQRGLADLAWEARARRSGTPSALREALTAVATALLDAARAAADAERLLSRTDERALARRLREYRDLAVVSRTAEGEAAAVERQLTLLQRVRVSRAALAAVEPEIEAAVTASSPTPETLASAVEPVSAAAAALTAVVEEAQNLLGDAAMRLRRTRSRGVYRLGDLYAVPFVDSLGLDRVRRFDSRREAKGFAYSLRFIAKAQTGYTGPSWRGADSSGGGGGPGP